MKTFLSIVLTAATLTDALVSVQNGYNGGDISVTFLNDSDTTDITNGSNADEKYCLPQFDPDPKGRATELAADHEGYQYSPSLIGNSSFFIGGPKGQAVVQRDQTLWLNDAAIQRQQVIQEEGMAQKALEAVSVDAEEPIQRF